MIYYEFMIYSKNMKTCGAKRSSYGVRNLPNGKAVTYRHQPNDELPPKYFCPQAKKADRKRNTKQIQVYGSGFKGKPSHTWTQK
jgi:hypothetical protein